MGEVPSLRHVRGRKAGSACQWTLGMSLGALVLWCRWRFTHCCLLLSLTKTVYTSHDLRHGPPRSTHSVMTEAEKWRIKNEKLEVLQDRAFIRAIAKRTGAYIDEEVHAWRAVGLGKEGQAQAEARWGGGHVGWAPSAW